MEFHGAPSLLHQYSVSVPPPPLTADKSPAVENTGGGCDGAVMEVEEPTTSETAAEEEGGRERLKRHRREMGGRVWIPEIWGQEELLKDWIDCSAFDATLFPAGIGSARAALVEEGRRANNGGFGLENSCSDFSVTFFRAS